MKKLLMKIIDSDFFLIVLCVVSTVLSGYLIDKMHSNSKNIEFKHTPMIPIQVDQKEKSCLIEALWYEARGESELGIKAVASVVVNRKDNKLLGETLCEVIEYGSQFSYRNNLRAGESLGVLKVYQSTQRYTYVSALAQEVVEGSFKPVLGASTMWYTTTSIKPPVWTVYLSKDVTIDSHVFYKIKE
jgi:spore germination cell wall hydrolase CwlJ-like protein